MSLRVAFDLDGTIADMQAVLRREAERLFAEPAPDVDAAPAADTASAGEKSATPPAEPRSVRVFSELTLTARQQSMLWEQVRRTENFWSGLPEMTPGIVARIAQTARDRRWEVIFLTTRPLVSGETTQVQSQRWLRAHGFELPSVFVVQRSRGKVADALELDAVVDDRPENCLDVAVDSKAKPILIWPGKTAEAPPGAKRLGVRLVGSIAEALDVLIRIDELKKERGVIRSLKKLFGRETPA